VSTRAPKQIVRDVETRSTSFLKRGIDHRMISVALQAPECGRPRPRAGSRRLRRRPRRPCPRRSAGPVAVFRRPAPVAAGETCFTPARGRPSDTVRFVNANLFVSGLRTQAEVELSWQGRRGSATRPGRRRGTTPIGCSRRRRCRRWRRFSADVTLAAHDVEFTAWVARMRWWWR
jgi:hypothetical protein